MAGEVIIKPAHADSFQGCTSGYWKEHLDAWFSTGFSPNQNLNTVFNSAYLGGLGNKTLDAALNFQEGSTLQGAKEILLRAAVAALLNAAHPNMDYPLTTT